MKNPSYCIVTFGCAANEADSERIASLYQNRGFIQVSDANQADELIINTCMIRESAENRVYGLINNLKKDRQKGRKIRIVVTGCMVGLMVKDKSGKLMRAFRQKMPEVDEFLPIEEVGFSIAPIRSGYKNALVPISNGCNNYCSYCVVPYTRGAEISRPYKEILNECRELIKKGYTEITLIGQNVNSYGADFFIKKGKESAKQEVTYVKHLGKYRIPTLFPQLLKEISGLKGLEKVDFISSNPWDFSEDLIRVIADNQIITRTIHLPLQSGDNDVLKKMNRWYTREEYLDLISKLKTQIPKVSISTDIIVGFCGESDEQFENTVKLCKIVGFSKAYISIYSDRPATQAHKIFKDDIPFVVKKYRWNILEKMINKPNLKHK